MPTTDFIAAIGSAGSIISLSIAWFQWRARKNDRNEAAATRAKALGSITSSFSKVHHMLWWIENKGVDVQRQTSELHLLAAELKMAALALGQERIEVTDPFPTDGLNTGNWTTTT